MRKLSKNTTINILIVVIGLFLITTSFVYVKKFKRPDIGLLTEKTFEWSPEDGALPKFTEITQELGLIIEKTESNNELRGGVAIVDINADGLNDIVTANKNLDMFINKGNENFDKISGTHSITSGEIVSVGYGDIDGDGFLDILAGTDNSLVIIVWGGLWIETQDFAKAVVTKIPASVVTTGVLAGDLSGDAQIDILALGYGGPTKKSDDIIFEQISKRVFKKTILPDSNRYTLAGELSDINNDGTTDIYAARDVGWKGGVDSLYTRSKNIWRDIAPSLKTDIAVDAMGITIADFNRDNTFDVYVSDIGDNELLLNSNDELAKDASLGLLRIRPKDATENTISSSWGSGVADFNADGRIDLLVVNGGPTANIFENKIKSTSIIQNDPPALFLQKKDGTYTDVWDKLNLEWNGSSRGLSIGDIDNDGDADIVIMNRDGNIKVYRNDTAIKTTTIAIAPTCSALIGSTLSIQGDTTNILTTLLAHSFLGAHASEFITKSEPLTITLTYNGKVVFSKEKTTLMQNRITIPCVLSS